MSRETPVARNADPATAHLGARRISPKRGTRRAQVLARLQTAAVRILSLGEAYVGLLQGDPRFAVALFDEAVPRATFVLHAVLNARLNHRPAHRLAAMLDKVRDGSLDAGPDRRDGVDPAGSNMSPWLAALTLQFRSHAGLHDWPADG